MPSFSLEDLQVFQKALAAAAEISTITERAAFRKDWDLRDQLRAASGRIPAHIAEGHGQKTDTHFAHYLYIARGSANEVCAHAKVALMRRLMTNAEYTDLQSRYQEIARMLTGLIQHLERENRRRRH